MFLCLLDPERGGVSDSQLHRYTSLWRKHGIAPRWRSIGSAQVLLACDGLPDDPGVVADGPWRAVGTARLDNRDALGLWAPTTSDLQIALRMVARKGRDAFAALLGDFAFVAWNDATREIIAGTDAFGVKRLCFTAHQNVLALATYADALATNAPYDAQYLAELVAGCTPDRHRTPYSGVRAVPAGHLLVHCSGRTAVHEYWSPRQYEPSLGVTGTRGRAIETCRHLLIDAVRSRLGGRSDVWAQLSGGIDSSSVVSIAQWLWHQDRVPHGVAGTVTYVDRQGTASDEREFSDLVAREWRVRNEIILDPPLWFIERETLPWSDFPNPFLLHLSRERQLCALVRSSGGRVLLTGQGSDELLSGMMLFFADWVARGKVGAAMKEMARRAALGRVSLWELAYRNVVIPLVPSVIRSRLLRLEEAVPPWVRREVIRRYNLRHRTFGTSNYRGRVGHKHHHAVLDNVASLRSNLEYGVIGQALDVRHPFLHRPLVEFALQLPPEWCSQPHARKWLLRQAIHGILPENVRTRVGKGGLSETYAVSLVKQRDLLEPLVRDSVLADLGIIDGHALRAAFLAAQTPQDDCVGDLVMSTLTTEAWLQIRSGRWPRGQAQHLASGNAHARSIAS
jgi:asparagine synthase (glutamine-hydrolysing)